MNWLSGKIQLGMRWAGWVKGLGFWFRVGVLSADCSAELAW